MDILYLHVKYPAFRRMLMQKTAAGFRSISSANPWQKTNYRSFGFNYPKDWKFIKPEAG